MTAVASPPRVGQRVAPYYSDESVVLYHGDCRDLLKSIDTGDVRCVVADPPYGETVLTWDRWPVGWVDAVAVAVPLCASLWCFGSMRMFLDRHEDFSGWRYAQEIVWEKHNGSNSAAGRFRRVHELALHWYRGEWANVHAEPVYTADAVKKRIHRRRKPAQWSAIGGHTHVSEDGGPRLMRSVIYARSEHSRAVNETQKPLAVVHPIIEHSCPRGGLVLSPFAGSGTDLVAAKVLGRRAIGIELRESQCEKAAERLMQGSLELEQ